MPFKDPDKCREMGRIYSKKYYDKKKNDPEWMERARARQSLLLSDPDFRAKKYAQIEKWRKKHPDRVRRAKREYQRRKLGWYEDNGMATEPAKARPIT